MNDVRYSLRMLSKNRATTAIAIVVLALGIGASATVFSVVNAILLRPLPGVAEPGRLVSFYRSQRTDAFNNFGYPDYADYRDRNRSFSGLAAHCPAPLNFSNGSSERVRGDVVTGNYFEVLGAQPAIGRLLRSQDDDGTEMQAAAVLSYGLWQRKFGGVPSTIGTSIVLNGYPFTVVGVASREFQGSLTGDSFDVWVPLSTQRRGRTISHLSENIFENRAAGWLAVFGRLRPNATFEQAEAETKTIASQLAQAYPATNAGRTANLLRGIGLYPDQQTAVSGLLELLSGAVVVLWLIMCANVAGLLMVRARSRGREFAVRLAVGASPARIVRQLLLEGILLSLLGGALGLALSAESAQWMASLGISLAGFRHLMVGVDARVFGFTLTVCFATGLLFTALPALQSLRVDLVTSLKNGSPGGGHRHSRLRTAMVVGQVALSFTLLTAAAVLVQNLWRIVLASPGFETRNVAMASVDLTIQRYSEQQGLTFYRELQQRLVGLPGVASASLASTVPPKDLGGRVSIFYPGQEPPLDALRANEFELGLRVDIDSIAPRYFATLGIPLLQGRDFSERDRGGAPGVVILSQKLAERLWPRENPIGKRISWPPWQGPPRPPLVVIGVAADIKYRRLTSDPPLLMYVPVLQNYDGRTTIVVRTASDPRATIPDLEAVVKSIDKNTAVYGAETMRGHIAASLWQERMAASWIGGFSLFALVLAAVGLYGVVAQSVAQRTRELGIRMAVGATPGSVVQMIVKEGLLLVLAALALGMPVGLALTRFMYRFLASVSGQNPAICAVVAALVMAIMVAACWIPARRASAVNAGDALRCE